MKYKCNRCGRIYEEEKVPQDGLCEDRDYYGQQLKEYPGESVGIIEGMCLLVCDASGSMDHKAFPDDPSDTVSKLRTVTDAVQLAVRGLEGITKPDGAFVGIIAFGEKAALVPDQQGRPFILSVSEIKSQFGDSLGEYLFACFQKDICNVDRGRTNIGAALQLARDVYDATIAGDFSRFDPRRTIRLLKQKDIDTFDKRHINVPNVRVMLYSDGEDNPEQPGELVNPFAKLQPSPRNCSGPRDERWVAAA